MDKFKAYLLPAVILVSGILFRLYFYVGHVFSDDAYYSFLSYNLFNQHSAESYLGYPIFQLRTGQLLLTNISFQIFGFREFGSIVFPFLFSISGLFLIYKIAFELTRKESIASLSMLLMAFFPTDVIFASINFVDLQNTFIIYLGLYLLIKASKTKSLQDSLFIGLLFALSFLIKENFYYYWILLFAIWIYLLFKKKEYHHQILTAMLIVFLFLIAEGEVYLFLNGDFFIPSDCTAIELYLQLL